MSAFCKNCSQEVHGFNNKMVILKDELWLLINGGYAGILCSDCIEQILRRPISIEDLKLDKNQHIPVNIDYMKSKQLIK